MVEFQIKIKGLSQEKTQEMFPYDPILVGYRGSIAHGMYIPNNDPNSTDDKDLMGVCIGPNEIYIGLKNWETKEVQYEEYDSVCYEFRKFIRLLIKSNPNVLSMLWMAPEHYIYKNWVGDLLIKHRNWFVSKQIYKAYTGYAYSQLKKVEAYNKEGYMGEKRRRLVEQYGYDCYDEATTEFLTPTGWKYFDQVDEGIVGTITENGTLEFQEFLSRTDKLYSGELFTIDGYGTRTTVTRNHNMLVSNTHRSNKNNFSVEYNEESADWQLLPLSSLLASNKGVFHIRRAPEERVLADTNVTDTYLKLGALYLSDGTTQFRDGKVKAIRLCQKADTGFFKLADECAKVFSGRRYDYEKETVWIFHGEVAEQINHDFGHSKHKQIPNWLITASPRQIKLFWDTSLYGDGTRKEANEVFYTSLKQVADKLHAALVAAGIHSTVYGPYFSETTFGTSTQYQVVKPNTAKVVTMYKGRNITREVVHNRRVVCFEVPNGTLITRNSGKVAVHGNCKNAAHLIRLLRMGTEFLNTGELIVLRHDAPQLLEIKTGKWSLERIKKEAEYEFKRADAAFDRSVLPTVPHLDKIEEMVMDVLLAYVVG